jgi:hypothetical protein
MMSTPVYGVAVPKKEPGAPIWLHLLSQHSQRITEVGFRVLPPEATLRHFHEKGP